MLATVESMNRLKINESPCTYCRINGFCHNGFRMATKNARINCNCICVCTRGPVYKIILEMCYTVKTVCNMNPVIPQIILPNKTRMSNKGWIRWTEGFFQKQAASVWVEFWPILTGFSVAFVASQQTKTIYFSLNSVCRVMFTRCLLLVFIKIFY